MLIDAVFVIVMILALVYGFMKGFIESLFHLIAIIIGIMAAVNLSRIVSVYIERWFNISSKYLPLISFIILFIAVLLLFRLLSGLMEGIFKALHINFINKLAGALIWAVAWTMIYSTLLFYGNQMKLFSDELKNTSVVYPKIQPLAPEVTEKIGKLIPPVKNIFNSLEEWFKEFGEETTEKS